MYSPQSHSYELYRYPKEVFPPTDFHTATLLDKYIWIVGNLGYMHERGTVTPVYRLDINTLAINKVEIDGESPGWIYKHTASSRGADIVEIVAESVVWELDVKKRKWRKIGSVQ
jgi:hypothetical protein